MKIPRGLALLLSVCVLVGVANATAVAATGKAFVLGKLNRAGAPTVLANRGEGPALELRSKPTAPPLRVTSDVKVARLNADRLDGLDAGQLRTSAYEYVLPPAGATNSVGFPFPSLPPGRYLASYSVQASAGASTNGFLCEFGPLAGGKGRGTALGAAFQTDRTASATTVLDTTSGAWGLSCVGGPNPFTLSQENVLTATFVVLDQVSSLPPEVS